jgi:NAD(P)-dependent dehydrogenase (short-subunit alcohol dehydrogenase family)
VASFFLTQLVSKEMIKLIKEGIIVDPKIINISSMSAYTSSTSRAEYCISKAGVSMSTLLFADRLAEEGINVYEIRPGIIKTPLTEIVSDKYDKLISEGITPIKRWGQPEDIAKAILAIAEGYFPFSTGQAFDVDGGFHIHRL